MGPALLRACRSSASSKFQTGGVTSLRPTPRGERLRRRVGGVSTFPLSRDWFPVMYRPTPRRGRQSQEESQFIGFLDVYSCHFAWSPEREKEMLYQLLLLLKTLC